MTEQEQPEHAVYAGVPTGENPYALQTRNGALTPRQKRGAAWAGIVGFNVVTLGWTLVVIPLMFALFGALFSVVLNEFRRSANGLGQGSRQFLDFFDSMNFGLLVVPAIIMIVVGLILMALAILGSRAILKAHAVNRPTAVTWAGVGVAIVGSWFVSWLPVVVAELVGGLMVSTDAGTVGTVAVVGGLFTLLSIATTSVVGWLAWWWMAHVLRGAPTPATPAYSTPTTP